jgi:hypothetical protein
MLAHGGIDLWPAWIARATCADDTQIVCGRAINGLFSVVTCGLFACVLATIAGLGTLRSIVAGMPAMATLVAHYGIGRSAFFMQTASPNLRELFLLAILAGLFLLYRSGESMSQIARLAVAIAVGALAGFGLFWIHNRGQFGIGLALGAAWALSAAWTDRRPTVGTVAGVLLGIALAWVSGLYGDIPAQFEAMRYWLEHNEIYRVSPDIDVFREILPVLPLCVALWTAVAVIAVRAGARRDLIPMATLTAVMVFFVWQAWLRPFAAYVAHTLWGASLLFALLFGRFAVPTAGRARLAVMTLASVAASINCMVLTAGYLPPNPVRWADNLIANFRTLTQPLPHDATLVEPGLAEAAATVRRGELTCSQTFTNEGMFYVMANVQPCSRFAYPFYVARDHEDAFLAEIRQTRPPVVLWNSPSWTNAIYGLDLAARTPELATRIPELYPYRRVLTGGYELRGLAPFGPEERH